jgi:hypothetical protein
MCGPIRSEMATFVPEAAASTGREVAVVGPLHFNESTRREGGDVPGGRPSGFPPILANCH